MPAPSRFTFLLVDHNADSRLLLGRTLLRKFPGALIKECDTAPAALAAVQSAAIDVAICHRLDGHDGATVVGLLRQANPAVPIIMVSGINRSHEARKAGANAFLNFDEWLTLGTVVERLLTAKPPAAPEPK